MPWTVTHVSVGCGDGAILDDRDQDADQASGARLETVARVLRGVHMEPRVHGLFIFPIYTRPTFIPNFQTSPSPPPQIDMTPFFSSFSGRHVIDPIAGRPATPNETSDASTSCEFFFLGLRLRYCGGTSFGNTPNIPI